MYLDELINMLQDRRNKKGNMPVEFALHSYTQVHPTVYMRNTPNIKAVHDGVIRITLDTGKDVRISILNKKTIAFVCD